MPSLAASALVGAVLGLAVWSWLGGSDAADDPAASGERSSRNPSRGVGPLGSPEARRGEARDHRPPHAPRVPATPPRLEIPAIGVRAHVSPLGTTSSGALSVPDNWSVVGWWRGGSEPGEPGPAALVGHVDSQTRPAVFHRLRELRPGDLIRFVRRDTSSARFVVVRKQQVPKTEFPTASVYGETREPTLRLITCGGSFDWSRGHYRDNVIVYAEQA